MIDLLFKRKVLDYSDECIIAHYKKKNNQVFIHIYVCIYLCIIVCYN